MASPNQEAIETFMSITGVPEQLAVQKLEEHGGDLNAAVNAHFIEGDRNILHETPIVGSQDDFMEIDDPVPTGVEIPPFSPEALNPLSRVNPSYARSLFETSSDLMNRDSSSPPEHSPIIESETDTHRTHVQGINRTVFLDDDDEEKEDEENSSAVPNPWVALHNRPESGVVSHSSRVPSAPEYNGYSAPVYNSNDIEEEMIRAAIEASKQDVWDLDDFRPQMQPRLDTDLENAVSLSFKAAKQEKESEDVGGKTVVAEVGTSSTAEQELGKIAASNGRVEAGSSSVLDGEENLTEEQPLVRRRTRRMPSSRVRPTKEEADFEVSPPSSPGLNDNDDHPRRINGDVFPSDVWGGISSEEHDEAVMLEAAMFGGVPETGYHFPHTSHQFRPSSLPYQRPVPRPPSPSLTAQRLIREQQDDEYLASLQADREKELKAIEEAEARRLQEEAARKLAYDEEKQKEEESRRKLEEEQELERQLAAKEASLPQEPSSEDENAVNLMIRMPDGSRHGRRFLKFDKLQSLFDFIDVGRVMKPGTYRLVRPYPRRTFSNGEMGLTLNELGLSSKQEALFLELI